VTQLEQLRAGSRRRGIDYIPCALRIDLRQPKIGCEGAEYVWCFGHGVPSPTAGCGDLVMVVERAVGEEALPEVEPDPLDEVELGGVGRQRDQGDVVRHGPGAGAVPSGLVEIHDGVKV